MRNSTKNYNCFTDEPDNWLELLYELFENPGQIEKFRNWLGYCLARNTGNRQLLILETPSVKARKLITGILKNLVGYKSSLDDDLSVFLRSVGHESLLGKSLAILDSSYCPPKYAYAIHNSISKICSQNSIEVTRLMHPNFTTVLRVHLLVSSDDNCWLNAAKFEHDFEILHIKLRNKKFPKRYSEIADKLRLELPKIARWAMTAYEINYIANGSESQSLFECRKPFCTEQTILGKQLNYFINNFCETGQSCTVPIREFYDAFLLMHSKADWLGIPAIQSVGKTLLASDLKIRRGQSRIIGRYYKGLKLVDDWQDRLKSHDMKSYEELNE